MSVYVTGDTHGNAQEIRNTIAQISNPSKDDFIIIAGDAGFEYQQYNMGQAKREARRFPGTWIVLRGNHDSRYWKEHSVWDDSLNKRIARDGWEFTQDNLYLYQKKYPNIWYVADTGGIYNIGDYNILFIPGAYSVDKWYRLRTGRPWNAEEQLTADEQAALVSLFYNWIDIGFEIDFVVGHTFPFKTQKYYQDLFMQGLDQTSVDKTMERWLDIFSDAYENAPSFKQYFGGHFHDDRVLNEKYTMLFHEVENLDDYIVKE